MHCAGSCSLDCGTFVSLSVASAGLGFWKNSDVGGLRRLVGWQNPLEPIAAMAAAAPHPNAGQSDEKCHNALGQP